MRPDDHFVNPYADQSSAKSSWPDTAGGHSAGLRDICAVGSLAIESCGREIDHDGAGEFGGSHSGFHSTR